ncbi:MULTISPECIES: sigma-70 family RNA polymerase sigma factor [Actinokineospora]|uniref:RNA polymerase sigma-70 factor (ECF subfamily) n=2 Tax=Actinokineospora TaxID=39845 RepID=A0A421AWX0_9PSEU|nr:MULTISPECIES: sigma-70 family RNA polymerase sigma factor [Actinokineospora]RLK54327.1 RNA polymerase sigma-70 factor (ECF subfamily) [Actinokineospora cianjurensis]SEQ96016.1 RNA polymerase sigma-70 factor, ECF subfamily [Actinokineospora terrae]
MTTFDSIVAAHRTALLAYARRVTGCPHRAEDVVQETWIRAWRHQDRLTEDRGSVRAWLTRVAHNIAVDQHRGRAARPSEVELPEVDTTSAPARTDEVIDRLLVDAALDTLPEPHRQTVVEVYFADRTAAAAAITLRVPVGTVKSRLHYALRTLRESTLTAA